jgi:transcriptional regulator with XRE-family HTH domain
MTKTNQNKKIPRWTAYAYYEAITEEMRELMDKQAITQAELAHRLGVSPPYINKLMRGETNFTIESLVKIAKALNAVLTVNLKEAVDK